MAINRIIQDVRGYLCVGVMSVMFMAMPVSPAAAQMSGADESASALTRMRYNNPGLVVDLGVGLWANPLPMDLDGDGSLDMVVASMGVPERGIYRFEPADDGHPMATYKSGEKIAAATHNLRSCKTSDGKWVVLSPGKLYTDFAHSGLSKWEKIPYETPHFPYDFPKRWNGMYVFPVY